MATEFPHFVDLQEGNSPEPGVHVLADAAYLNSVNLAINTLENTMPGKADASTLAAVATSGSYEDLSGKPFIPSDPEDIGAQPAGDYATTDDLAGKADAEHTHTVADIDASGTPSDTTFLRGDGTWATPEGGGSGGGGLVPPVCLVVASDAPSAYRSAASGAAEHVFVCDGTDDQEEIQAAIDLAAALADRNEDSPAGAEQWGLVQLSGGRFNITAAIECRTGVRLTGAGWLTELRADSCDDDALLILASDDEHLIQVDHLYLYGNYSSGGACSAIHFDMTNSTNQGVGQYPSSSPDAYHKLTDLYIDGFDSTPDRNGIRLYCDSTANQRGWIIDRVQIRNISGNGIWVESSSDGFISNVHIGTVGGSGFVIDTANVKMANCKAFYCDEWALDWQSAQGVCTGFEAQDCGKGVYAAGRQSALAGIVIDDCEEEGLVVDASRQAITGLAVSKAAARYEEMLYGVRFSSGDEVVVIGSVASTDISTRISGEPGEGSFIRITGDGEVYGGGGGEVDISDVDGLQDALNSKASATVTANTQSGTSYTLQLPDGGKVVEMNNVSSNTLTVPPNSSVAFPTGTIIEVCQMGSGQTTIAAGSGVTLRAPRGAKLAVRYASASLRKRDTNEWVLTGDVTE